MSSGIEKLVCENARAAREMRGVALLHFPQPSDESWRVRRNALLRAGCFKGSAEKALDGHCAKKGCEEDQQEEQHGKEVGETNALVFFPPKKPQTDVISSSPVAQKRRRSEDAIISVDPKVLKNRLNAVSTSVLGGPHKEKYVPPPAWKLSKVLVGHQGWVWSVAIDPSNSWFATGGGDGVVKVWDLTTGALKLNLTGHKEGVRAVSLSTLSPYMFTGSDDHSVKCWDLERNETIRDFHGHKSSVHCVSAHPALDIVVSGGRDKTVRVWDIRTRSCVHILTGHNDSVMSLVTQQGDPQAISGGSDGMIYLWDIAAGRAFTRLTRHKKPVRGLAVNHQGTLVSCGADNIRVWSLSRREFLFNASVAATGGGGGSKAEEADDVCYRWSCCAFSPLNVLAVGSQEGKLALYDWRHQQNPPYQLTKTKSIPGTLPGEGGINSLTFDVSGSRMITVESDKSVKVWRSRE